MVYIVNINEILKRYPKTKIPLSKKHTDVYEKEYKLNRDGKGLLFSTLRLLESWLHIMISKNHAGGKLLEIGSGTLNHIPYEKEYLSYDCIEPFKALYENSTNLKYVNNLYIDINEVPVENKYDRIISIAVMEHILDLPSIIAKTTLLLNENGVFQASIPSEGGFLWGISWRLTTAISYRIRTGLDYKSVIRHEHVNNEKEIVEIIKHFYKKVKIKRFPTPLFQLSFYSYIEAESPDIKKSMQYLENK